MVIYDIVNCMVAYNIVHCMTIYKVVHCMVIYNIVDCMVVYYSSLYGYLQNSSLYGSQLRGSSVYTEHRRVSIPLLTPFPARLLIRWLITFEQLTAAIGEGLVGMHQEVCPGFRGVSSLFPHAHTPTPHTIWRWDPAPTVTGTARFSHGLRQDKNVYRFIWTLTSKTWPRLNRRITGLLESVAVHLHTHHTLGSFSTTSLEWYVHFSAPGLVIALSQPPRRKTLIPQIKQV